MAQQVLTLAKVWVIPFSASGGGVGHDSFWQGAVFLESYRKVFRDRISCNL